MRTTQFHWIHTILGSRGSCAQRNANKMLKAGIITFWKVVVLAIPLRFSCCVSFTSVQNLCTNCEWAARIEIFFRSSQTNAALLRMKYLWPVATNDCNNNFQLQWLWVRCTYPEQRSADVLDLSEKGRKTFRNCEYFIIIYGIWYYIFVLLLAG